MAITQTAIPSWTNGCTPQRCGCVGGFAECGTGLLRDLFKKK
jgi:hypothetical protein